ncbi:putative HTH-type transcriptional regulator YjiR [Rosistilla oblonga]|nr:putative HTH-type transcriptional regulator YjiR [Rosistilla oblonga]
MVVKNKTSQRRDDWLPDVERPDIPIYLAVAEAIAADIQDGRLRGGDHLPTQRTLAKRLNLDVTTIARGYSEAARRGLVEARVGAGTFVRRSSPQPTRVGRQFDLADRSMNQPPDVADPDVLTAIADSFQVVSESMPSVLRYQPLGGSMRDRAAAIRWLSNRGIDAGPEAVYVTAGAHVALGAIVAKIGSPDDVIGCDQITYSGIKEVASTLRRRLMGLPGDAHGMLPAALDRAARENRVRVVYVNPTLRNPTVETMPIQRRSEIVQVARKHGIAIIEDDAYGMLPTAGPPPFAALAPEITFYVTTLAKCLAPGLRIAYLVAPRDQRASGVLSALRAVSVMASPVCATLATHWIESGLADAVLASVRSSTRARQRLLKRYLPADIVQTDEHAFHAWIRLKKPWTRAHLVDWMRGYALGVVASDRFCVDIEAPEALRVCLGGAASLQETELAIQALWGALQTEPNAI